MIFINYVKKFKKKKSVIIVWHDAIFGFFLPKGPSQALYIEENLPHNIYFVTKLIIKFPLQNIIIT